MNGIKVAKIANLDSIENVKDLKGTIDFDNYNILSVLYIN